MGRHAHFVHSVLVAGLEGFDFLLGTMGPRSPPLQVCHNSKLCGRLTWTPPVTRRWFLSCGMPAAGRSGSVTGRTPKSPIHAAAS